MSIAKGSRVYRRSHAASHPTGPVGVVRGINETHAVVEWQIPDGGRDLVVLSSLIRVESEGKEPKA